MPDVHWLDDPAWVAAEGYHNVAADYRLLNDNLLDLSHETYVHTRTIGHEAVAESPIAVKVEEALGAHRQGDARLHAAAVLPVPRPPQGRPTASTAGSAPCTEPPGYIVIDVGVQPLDASGRLEPRRGPRDQPDDAGNGVGSTHYFWAFARNFRLDEPGVTEFLRANVGRTFDEDKDMLESQQRNIGTVAEPVFSIAVKADVGPTQGRRLLASHDRGRGPRRLSEAPGRPLP